MKNAAICTILIFASFQAICQSLSPVELADLQLKGYNERNIDLFLEAYSDSVKAYNFPNTLQYKGKDMMKLIYQEMFARSTDLHCTIRSRMVIGNTVIDEENVVFSKGGAFLHAIAIYKIAHNKIQEVYFITQ